MDYQIFRYLGLPIRIKVKIFTYLYLYYRDDVAYLCPIRVEWEIKIKDPYFETRLEWLLSTIEGELGRLNTVDLRGEIGMICDHYWKQYIQYAPISHRAYVQYVRATYYKQYDYICRRGLPDMKILIIGPLIHSDFTHRKLDPRGHGFDYMVESKTVVKYWGRPHSISKGNSLSLD